MKNKKLKYAINSSIVVIGFLAIIILFNVLVSVFVSKVPVKIDLTSSKIYEISDKTYDFLDSYNTPVTIYILASEAEQDKNVRTILDKYAMANSNIKIQNINPNENPTFGKKYVDGGNTLYKNSIIVDAGERFKVYKGSDLYTVDGSTQTATSIKVEQKITAALKYVASDEDFTVYIVKGHGEIDLEGAKAKLQTENYIVKELNIVTDEIPDDAKMLIISSPTSDYTMSDIAKLDAFFNKAGKAQFLFDTYSSNLTNLYSYLREWGIEVTDTIAVEQSKDNIMLVRNTPLIMPVYEENDITSAISSDKRVMGYYPYSKVLNTLFESNNGIEVKKILSTTSNAYIKDALSDDLSKGNDDKLGTFTVAATATKMGDSPDQDAMIFVSGNTMLLDIDPDVITNQFGFANYDLYMNVMTFLQGSKDDYSITARSLIADKLTIPTLDILILGVLFIVLIPLAVLITGIVIWVRRRHL